MTFRDAVNIGMILISALLVGVVLLQLKGNTLSGMLGGSGSMYRTRRGVEKTLLQVTVVLVVVLVILAVVTVRAH